MGILLWCVDTKLSRLMSLKWDELKLLHIFMKWGKCVSKSILSRCTQGKYKLTWNMPNKISCMPYKFV